MTLKKLLVVDDSATTRMLISLTLKKDGGYRIVEVTNGREAVERLEKDSFDCVITDINMPEMNGLELVSHVRSRCGSELPVVVITTQGEESSRDEGLARGANAYLTKPISGPQLSSLIKELLAETVMTDG